MSDRDPRWYIDHDGSGLVRGVESQLDLLRLQENELARYRHPETVARLERLGLRELADAYREPPPLLDERELHRSRHPTSAHYDMDHHERQRQRSAPLARRLRLS